MKQREREMIHIREGALLTGEFPCLRSLLESLSHHFSGGAAAAGGGILAPSISELSRLGISRDYGSIIF